MNLTKALRRTFRALDVSAHARRHGCLGLSNTVAESSRLCIVYDEGGDPDDREAVAKQI